MRQFFERRTIMNSSPLVAIIPAYSDDEKIRLSPEYPAALLDCGVIPVTLPYSKDPAVIRSYAERFDAFLFSGGVDLEPALYGEEKSSDLVVTDPNRDRFELALFPEALKTNKPILGICRGSQLMNVASGGTLYQHIDGHRQTEAGAVTTHSVRIAPDSRLFSIIGKETVSVNSLHHQAVKDVAPTLRAVAWNEEGFVEAVEDPSHPFFVAVQWHPELLYESSADAKAIFRAFVAAI